MTTWRFNNIVAATGDSKLWMGPGFKNEDQTYLQVLGEAISGYNRTTVVSASFVASTITVAPGAGSTFQPGTQFALRSADTYVALGRETAKTLNPNFVVVSQSGDVLTVSPPPNALLPAGAQLIGCGGLVDCVAVNGSHSGDTSAQCLAKLPEVTEYGTPIILLIEPAVNDLNPQGTSTVQASPAPSYSSGVVTFSVAATWVSQGIASLGSRLIINGVPNYTVTALSGDAITATVPTAGPTSAPISGQTVTLDTTNTLNAIAVKAASMGIPNILFVGDSGNNWATGGDYTVSGQTGSVLSVNTTVSTVATALGVPFYDAYAFFSSRVTNSIDSATSNSFNYCTGNPHYSPYGDQINAYGLMAKIVSLGWISKFK